MAKVKMATELKTTYLLLVYLPSKRKIRIGRLGEIVFKKGFYLYVGSGGRSPLKRIGRHASKNKKCFWHIDFLTSRGKVIGALIVETKKSVECELSHILQSHFQSIEGFGCSDCSCKSHLFYLVEDTAKEGKR